MYAGIGGGIFAIVAGTLTIYFCFCKNKNEEEVIFYLSFYYKSIYRIIFSMS